MTIDEFEKYLASTARAFHTVNVGANRYLVITAVPITAGTHAGKSCDFGILHSTANPWVPESAVHVRPRLVEMGQASSQASPLGADWQYLSRRFDKAPTPKAFFTYLLTVVGEL